ncbi:MAG: M48 family peptidase, partial [Acidobacteria bacterium]
AQEPPPAAAQEPPPAAAQEPPQIAGAVERGKVAVPEPSEKALRYHRGNTLWWIFNTFLGLLIPAVLLFTGFSARMRDLARRLGKSWYFTVILYFVLFILLTTVIDLPRSYLQDFAREHAYGLSNQTLGKWLGDAFKGLGVGLVTAVLFGWIPYLILSKSPRRWWLYTALALVPFFFFVNLVTPVWVAPLFNDFGPMEDKDLERDILALAERAGIEGSRVFEVEKSVDTEAVNAYVAGFLNTKRIVLWDTIIAKLERDELLFVMGHEMGHYVLKHVIYSILFVSLLVLLALYLIYRTAGGLIARYRHRFGFDRLSDVASLPLLLLLFNVFAFLLAPVGLAFSRHLEHEADRFGLELTRDNHAAAMAFVKLQQENLGVPRPGLLYKLWRASHPTLGERIDFCNAYRPWETGEPLRYQHLFAGGAP